MSWQIVFTRQARKDARRIAAAGLRPKAESLLTLLAENPFRRPPPFERLVGDLKGAYSRRINIQHRLVYEVIDAEKIVKVLRLWSHYE
ncbi:MAG: Txe/YoeB family addiction module toxin [Pirellulales bacterium]|nr:Txe/YoeB family addiction module toxin [Pirellulales bacterium]MBL7193291.1 Txe/YoeB family addiction module toxin [Pirellulales bacterium]